MKRFGNPTKVGDAVIGLFYKGLKEVFFRKEKIDMNYQFCSLFKECFRLYSTDTHFVDVVDIEPQDIRMIPLKRYIGEFLVNREKTIEKYLGSLENTIPPALMFEERGMSFIASPEKLLEKITHIIQIRNFGDGITREIYRLDAVQKKEILNQVTIIKMEKEYETK